MSDLLRGLRDGANKATFEAARLYRIQQAQAQLNGLQAEKKDKLRALGEIVWDMFLASQVSEPRLLDVCRQVNVIEQQVRDMQRRIEDIKQEQPPEPPKCTKCGRELSDHDAFCPGCGTSVVKPQPTPTPAASQTTCPQCGKALRTEAVFCGGCGYRFGAASTGGSI